MTQRQPAIYIMANRRNGTLYTGVTNDLIRRVYQHKHGSIPGFTKQYNCTQLVYYEQCDEMIPAIEREKQIKGGSRKKKLALIESINPKWIDLYDPKFGS
jgi:putative endonuclease